MGPGLVSSCLCITYYTHSHMYIEIYTGTTIILFLVSFLVNHFISTHKFSFFSPIVSPIPPGRGELSKRLCGAEPNAGLNLTCQSLESYHVA